MPRIFKHLKARCLQVNLMSNSAKINQLKYTILYNKFIKINVQQTPYNAHENGNL